MDLFLGPDSGLLASRTVQLRCRHLARLNSHHGQGVKHFHFDKAEAGV